jgi:hypothetical protein
MRASAGFAAVRGRSSDAAGSRSGILTPPPRFAPPAGMPAQPTFVPTTPLRRTAVVARLLAATLWAVALVVAAFPSAPARADVIVATSAELRTEEDGYYLNAEFELAINPTLEEALQKGIPLYFLLEFEITRPRWYWLDEKILSTTTQHRVSYNALTRQYRVSSGLLTQTLNSLEEVERLLSRVTSRPVARTDQLTPGARYEAAVRLRLDVNQLPKPFQVNALTSRDWSLQSDWRRWSYTP